jgi:putative DeoR family transcriptional regulator (stage III sporulation protein D)
MNKNIIKRVIDEGNYIINNKETVRSVAKIFNVSKSTVHKDMQDRLKEIDYELFKKVDKIFKYHIKIRHINGGEATRCKYLKLKSI